MGRKSKKALARIMALLMAFALLPFDLWGTANMVIAEETSEAYTEEAASTEDDAAVTEDITDTQDEGTDDALADDVVAKEHESSDAAFTEEITDIESVEEDSAFSGEVETSEETKEVEVQEEEKPSTEIVNKVQVMYVHNFTTDGHESDDFFNISGKKQGSPISFTYVDKNNKELTLEAALKMESATSISFNAMNAGTLVLVHPTSFTKSTKVDGNKKTAVEGIIEVPLDAGTHTITKGDTTDLYYIAFITEAAEAKEKAAKPTADPVSGEIEIGGKITLSCATPDATIYYTTDGNEPKDNASKNTYSNEITIESNMVTSDNKITIKAYAEKEGYDDSDTETFEYTVVTTGKPQVNVSTDSEDIDSVKTVGDIYFVNESGKEVAAVKLKVQKVTVSEVDANVKAEAEKLKKEGGEILYYDFSLVNAENENEIVSIAEGSTGKISIKMPYSVKSGTSKRNEIIVLHNTNKVEVTKESDGFSFSADSFSPYTVVINPANAVQLSITRSAGYEEGAYAEWEAVDGADGYMAYAAPAGGKFKRIDDELIREYSDHWRVDTVGLAKGTYYIKVDAVTLETKGAETTATVIATNTTDALKVTNYDRSGFAFSSKSPLGTGSGAYNDDGTLKDGAQVIYVTAETAKTVTATVNNTTCTGLQAILAAKEKKGTSGDILDIRIIGCVTRADLDSIGSSEEGLQVKGNKAYENMNITIEGIGEDAAVKDFGFLIRNCGNVELRNFGILAFMDDGVSMDTGNCNIWVHDLDIFYGATGGDSDQAKGDGSVDIKAGSTYITVAYNHFWDSGKSSLCGMKSDIGKEFMVTYHHNWFDHSDSRHPRIRSGTIHIYNNYFDGNSKYGVGVTTGSSAFVDSNYFRNCKYPMLSSKQGTDAVGEGTFSGEDGGMIKAYNNIISGAQRLVYANAAYGSNAADSTQFDAYIASERNQQVPESYVTVAGGTKYNNFDTSSSYDLGVKQEYIDTPENVPTVVMAKAGRLNGGDFKWEFNNATEDTNSGVIKELKDAVVNYKTSVKNISGGVVGDVTVVDGENSNAPSGSSVSAPTANKNSGEVEKGTEIILSAANDAEIYYTLNGLDPTKDSESYTTPIVIDKDTMIKAIAVVGNSESSVSTFHYTVQGEHIPDPGPNPPGGDDTEEKAEIYEFNPELIGFELKDTETDSKGNVKQIYKLPIADTKYGTNDYFTIGNTSEKYGKIAKTSTSGGTTKAPTPSKSSVTEYTVRYQFGGAVDTADASKAIRFKNENKAKVYVAAYRINDEARNLYLDTNENVKTLSRTVTEYTFEDVEPGTHGIYAKDGDIAILYVIVEEFVPNESGDDVTVKAPTAKPVSGTEFPVGGGTVELDSATEDAKIYYTKDGTTPTKASAECTSPIAVDKTMTIKAIAVVNGKSSEVAIFEYKVTQDITPPAENQVGMPEANYPTKTTVKKGTEITLTCVPADAEIHYTLGGAVPTKDSDLYTKSIVIHEDTIIKAIAIKEGYKDSEMATFEYTVAKDEDVKQVAEPRANIASGTAVQKGTVITLTADPADAEIRYTLNETTPTQNSILYTKPIEINEDTTIKAFAAKQGYISSAVVTFVYTVIEDDPTIPEGSGLRVVLKNKETYTYTGSAIKPEILVYNNNDKLVEGTDYTVQYKNNINASTDAASNKKPQIIVRGRKNLTGSVYTTFEIEKKDIRDNSKGAGAVEVSGITGDGELLVVENTKVSPALYYGGVKLSGKYFSVSKTGKYTLGDTGSEIVITGKDNFEGELKYKVKVISKGSLKKFTVSFKNPNYIYNGQSQIFELAEGDVKDSSKTETNGASLKKGIDYTVVYQKDTTNAGNIKFTVVGLGYYTGAITKSYTIKPNAVNAGMKITGVSGRPYPYMGTGVTVPNVKVSYNDMPLEEGRDYKLIYSGNKKVGTAKVTASFIGNYKGSASVSKFFTIGANVLTDGAAGLKITVADMVYKKPGTYKSVPHVSVNGIEIKATNFIVKYYTDETLEKEVSSRNKIILSDKDAYKTVYMKITGKDRGNYQGTELTASYKVCQRTLGDFYDLSKARLIVYTNWSDSALRTNRIEHTGSAVEPGVAIEFRQDGAKIDLTPTEVKQLIDSGKLTIQYVNNVNRGRATIVVNGDGATYVGGKKVTFNIITRNIKNTDILDDLFTNAVEKCNIRYLLQNP